VFGEVYYKAEIGQRRLVDSAGGIEDKEGGEEEREGEYTGVVRGISREGTYAFRINDENIYVLPIRPIALN